VNRQSLLSRILIMVYCNGRNWYFGHCPCSQGNLTFILLMWRIGRAPNCIPIYSCIQKMQRHTVYLYLETALHISRGISTHHQERIHLHLQHLVFVTPLLLSAAIVEELGLVWVCCGWRTPQKFVCLLKQLSRKYLSKAIYRQRLFSQFRLLSVDSYKRRGE
jgi:hypothetical protein